MVRFLRKPERKALKERHGGGIWLFRTKDWYHGFQRPTWEEIKRAPEEDIVVTRVRKWYRKYKKSRMKKIRVRRRKSRSGNKMPLQLKRYWANKRR